MTGDPIPIMISGMSLGTALRIAAWSASIAARRSAGRLARYWSGVVGFITAQGFPGASLRQTLALSQTSLQPYPLSQNFGVEPIVCVCAKLAEREGLAACGRCFALALRATHLRSLCSLRRTLGGFSSLYDG